ncbi:MAG: hypothetical protein AAF351_02710 [Pseudomonadota bacterium]
MSSFATRYLNDIVSLTVLSLMAVAFVGAQSNALAHEHATTLQAETAAKLEAMIESSVIQADLSVDLDLLEIKLRVKD